jgi:hypothetical protein
MPAPPHPPDLTELHRRNNRESAGHWDHFQEHRARVTALALSTAGAGDAAGGGRLMVLGAGNCNDLDLAAIAPRFREVHLVDLDQEALRRARERQPAEVAARLVLHAPVDLSGGFDRLHRYRAQPATRAELAAMPEACTERVVAALPGGQDVVLSACFLSQLMHTAFMVLGDRHPQLHALACTFALAHLRSLVRLLAPGGTAHVVTDTVSSETYPLDELWGTRTPAALLDHLELTDNTFSGTSPAFLRRILASDRHVAPALAGPARLVEPWRWRFSDERSYLVYALTFTRAAT